MTMAGFFGKDYGGRGRLEVNLELLRLVNAHNCYTFICMLFFSDEIINYKNCTKCQIPKMRHSSKRQVHQ